MIKQKIAEMEREIEELSRRKDGKKRSFKSNLEILRECRLKGYLEAIEDVKALIEKKITNAKIVVKSDSDYGKELVEETMNKFKQVLSKEILEELQ